MNSLSPNTQAILLLTAPLIADKTSQAGVELLTPGEFRRLASQLDDLKREPADLLGTDAPEILRECEVVQPAARVQRLLDRGFLLSQAIERWQARAIWVVSRLDAHYPGRLLERLQDAAPAILYGCGEMAVIESGGLAMVGSRHVDESLIEYTESIGRLCARAGKTVVSGGAQGIDRAAMRGALEDDGRVTGVLADSLERAALDRENRNFFMNGQLALVSPYDPAAPFNVGNAMQRNKVIYALADAALVLSADFEKGGTWGGATEQLKKLRLVPLYVRSTGELGQGLEALRRMGAHPWPNPQMPKEFLDVFDRTPGAPQAEQRAEQQAELNFHSTPPESTAESTPHSAAPPATPAEAASSGADRPSRRSGSGGARRAAKTASGRQTQSNSDAALLSRMRDNLASLLTFPRGEADIAAELHVPKAQAKRCLQVLVAEGIVEKKKRPTAFVLKQNTLL